MTDFTCKPFALFAAAAASLGLVIATPAAAGIHFNDVSFGGVEFDDDEDLLTQLRELDDDEIAELKADLADAREEIADAIHEIEDAREEVKGTPGGGAILNAALDAAAVIVNKTVREAFAEVRTELDVAQTDLIALRSDMASEEYDRTQGVIDMIRSEMDSLEVALGELTDAMRG